MNHNYRYASTSAVTEKGAISWATSGGVDARREPVAHPFFFMGSITEPATTARALTALAKVVGSNFAAKGRLSKALRDPVVTCGDGILRFEGFSSCCGLYARLDLGESALEPVAMRHGTTNVDFNPPMRLALAKVRSRDSVGFSVGDEEFSMVRGDEVTVERKVDLPSRWVRGFTEAAVFQSRMEPAIELGKAHALQFLRTLTTSVKNAHCWLVPSAGGGVRVGRRETANAVRVHAMGRLAVLRDLMAQVQGLRIFHDPDERETSAWELDLGAQRLTLLLSPGLYRGFSGEGQALASLASGTEDEVLEAADETLGWQSDLSAENLAAILDIDEASARDALLTLGAQGLVGFDLTRRGFFHRELPFDRESIDLLNPRLVGARKLVAAKAVRWTEPGRVAEIASGTMRYRVDLGEDPPHCNCRWFAQHQGRRGTCKHVLAATIERNALQDDGQSCTNT